MTYVAIALAIALVVQQWQHHKHRMEWERVVRLERANLLNRIQAPELAVLPDLEPTPFVAPDDDKGFLEAEEERREMAS